MECFDQHRSLWSPWHNPRSCVITCAAHFMVFNPDQDLVLCNVSTPCLSKNFCSSHPVELVQGSWTFIVSEINDQRSSWMIRIKQIIKKKKSNLQHDQTQTSVIKTSLNFWTFLVTKSEPWRWEKCSVERQNRSPGTKRSWRANKKKKELWRGFSLIFRCQFWELSWCLIIW